MWNFFGEQRYSELVGGAASSVFGTFQSFLLSLCLFLDPELSWCCCVLSLSEQMTPLPLLVFFTFTPCSRLIQPMLQMNLGKTIPSLCSNKRSVFCEQMQVVFLVELELLPAPSYIIFFFLLICGCVFLINSFLLKFFSVQQRSVGLKVGQWVISGNRLWLAALKV